MTQRPVRQGAADHEVKASGSARAAAAATATAKQRSPLLRRLRERTIFATLLSAALFSILTTAAIIAVLSVETAHFFRDERVSVGGFFGSLQWNPLLGAERHFGVWPLVGGTFLVTAIAMVVALPLGLASAIYLSEYAPARGVLKPALEILAGIPTVIYGFFALVFITPGLQWFDPSFGAYNGLSAGIAVGVLCLPIVSSLCEDALRAVPDSLRQGAYGLGCTKFDTSVKVVVPAALSGIISAFLLAIARAVGETMIVALAAGSTPVLTADPRDSVQTMTGYMVQMALGDVSNFGVEYFSMYAVAAVLFGTTFALTLLGAVIRRRYREAYL